MKIMLWVMILMMGMFVWQSKAGLGVYWLIGNIYSMGQMFINNKNSAKKLEKLQNKQGIYTVNNSKKENINQDEDKYSKGTHHAQITIKDYGTINVELYADIAPITVANFAKLVNEGFYNGLTFHRIISGFMIQGGDPNGNGTGGSDENIKGEFAQNGVKNTLSHTRGVISMARSMAYNSASSQFFIMHKDYTGLDGAYAAFGKVTSGIEIVDKICEDVKIEDDNGTVLKENQPVIEKIEMID